MSMDALVVGGGIGGLTAALALTGDGHRVTVVEQTPRFEAVGAGIVLAPNAVQVLAILGVDLSDAGRPLHRTEVRTAGGALLNAIDLRALARQYGPTYGISRPALQAILAGALPAEVDVVHGHRVDRVDRVDEGSGGVTVSWGGSRQRFDVVVAADGLRSAVRSFVGGPSSLRYSGATCWRGVLPLEVGDGAVEAAVEAWGAGTRVGVVPIGAGQVYYYLVRSAPPGAGEPPWPEGFRAVFTGFGGVAGRLLQALAEAPPLHQDLSELDHPFWGRSRVLLLGDAAHAMTPNQGQGAAMAIEDAWALALALRPGTDGALRRYVAMRGRRVRRVQLTSRRIGEVAHQQVPALAWARNAAMRLVPASVGSRAVRRLVVPGVRLADLTETAAR
jgi:2-polyprenyl-6-methoxyphenol hydroxylase-like FAD-dependent oxidoreductase